MNDKKVLKTYPQRLLLWIGGLVCILLLTTGTMGAELFLEDKEAGLFTAFDTVDPSLQEELEQAREENLLVTGLSFLEKGQAHLFLSGKPALETVKKGLPKTLLSRLEDGREEELPVTWETQEDYEHTSYWYYTFSSILPEGRTLAGGVEPAYVTVFLGMGNGVSQTVGRLSGSTNEEKIYNFLLSSMKLNTAAACGVLANIHAESGFNPTTQGDGGTSYGICQWHMERKDRLLSYCKEHGYQASDLEGQLMYLQMELKTYYPKVLSILEGVENSAEGAYQAGYAWCRYFEVPSNVEAASQSRGRVAMETYWPKYSSSDPPSPTPTASPGEEDFTVTVRFENAQVQPGVNDATLSVQVKVEGGSCSAVGLTLYEEDGLEVGVAMDQTGATRVRFGVRASMGVSLMPQTTYEYSFFAIVNKREYRSQMYSFTTGENQSATPTPTPVKTPTPTPTPKVTQSPDQSSSFLLYHSVSLYVGSGIDEVTLVDEFPYGEKFTFASNNQKVATVDKNGKVKAVGKGEAVITAVRTAGGKTYKDSCTISVKKPTLSVVSKVTIKKNKTYALSVSSFPAGKITFKSSNTKIAKVSSKGVITGRKKGSCKISVTCNKVTKKVKVVVK